MDKVLSGAAAIGLGTPYGRFAAFSVLGFAGQLYLKPGIAYTKEGRMKPFSLFSSKKEESTLVPWWVLSIVPGLLGALFL